MTGARPPERNYGCRVSGDYIYRGLRVVVLENKSLRVSVLADKGTDIFELLYKPADIDFMYRAPAGVRDPKLNLPCIANPAGAYLDFWHGGWQEAFPTGGWPCQYRGASFGLHGEVSLLPWSYRIEEDTEDCVSVCFWTRTMRTPFLLCKTLKLANTEAILHMSERVTNEGRTPLEFMWGHHPVVGPPFLDQTCILTAPAETVVIPEATHWPHGRFREGRYRWPMVDDRNRIATDASAILPFNAGVADGMYLTDLRDGWCAVSSGTLGLSFGLSWTKEVFPWIWLWHVAGGETESPFFGRNYNLAIEPFSSYPNTFDSVRQAGSQKRLEPGESMEATVAAAVFPSQGIIQSISPEGFVTFTT